MSLAAVRKLALSGFLFPRHTMPMLAKPVTRTEVPVRPYHEICGFTKVSGNVGAPSWMYWAKPDLLDVLRAPR